MIQKREISSIILSIVAIFIFLTTQFPDKTGFMGQGIYLFLTTLFGLKGAILFPLFLLIPAFSLIITPISIKRTALASFICYCHIVILIHLNDTSFLWTPGALNGGYIGKIGAAIFLNLFGQYGSLIMISGALLISSIFIFQFSFFNVLILLKNKLTTMILSLKFPNTSILKPLLITLFFVKRPIIEPFTRSAIKKKKTKKQPVINPEDSFEIPDIHIPTPAISEPKQPKEKKTPPPPTKPVSTPPPDKITGFQVPSIDLLKQGNKNTEPNDSLQEYHKEQAKLLEMALESFNVETKVVNITSGPSVTRYELKPGEGVKISKITALAKDIALKLATPDVRIEAPIPGKALVGIEVPNASVDMVTLRSIMENTDFYERDSKLTAAIGLTITGESILLDLAKMPHMLIAGATGAGKSVCINTIIISILMRATPDEVKFLMIDPKKVELSLYENIPHLIAPVVTNPHMAAATLKKWALQEMENRYELFTNTGVKDIKGYNSYIESLPQENEPTDTDTPENDFPPPKKLPYIVVIIDELADLMMVASQDVEQTICRLAQMARATGIHLVIATQRPSVNVVTGLIKANVPSRISFYLQSQIDSRTILDMAGAEKLLGKGDMLYSPVGSFKPKRVQGVFISEEEVKNVVGWLKTQGKPDYDTELLEIEPLDPASSEDDAGADDLYEEAKKIVQNTKYASTSYLQRKLRIGYNRAARLMDELEENGIISSYSGEKKSRDVL